ncbi:MAG: hypothetical protein ACMV1D_10880 [Macromonas sp.]
MSDLLIAPAYAEIAALKRHFQLLNGSPEMLEFLMSPGVTGAGLQTLLASPVKLTQFQQFLASPVGAVSLAASSTAMSAVAASSTAMSAVIASSTAMSAVLNSATARKLVYDSNTAWNAVVGSDTAKAALLASSTEHSTNSTSQVYPTGSSAGVRAVLVQQRSSDGQTSYADSPSAGSYSTNSTSYIDRYARMTGLKHRTSNSGYTSYIKYIIME